jgi:response regulator RpfG family c-di-GMP phosphodiesterase
MAEGSVLLVAPNKGSAKQLFSALKKCEFTVSAVAGSGDEAIRHLKKNRVDSILFDSEDDREKIIADAIRVWKQYEIPIIFLSARLDHDFVSQVLDCEPYGILRKPWDLPELEAAVMASIHKSRIDRQERQIIAQVLRQSHNLKKVNDIMEQRLTSRMGEINQITDMYFLALEDMHQLFDRTIMLLANIIELRETVGTGHGRRIADHAQGLTSLMGLDRQQAQDIYYAALLHDVGLLAISDDILQKPYTEMTLQEGKLMERHCLIGEQIFSSLGPLKQAAKIIRSHHEFFNGKGFPDRLAGDEIPLGSRILLVLNDHDDLKSGAFDGISRSYIEARQYLREQKGKRYDPDVVDVFLQWLEEVDEHDFSEDIRIDLDEMQVDDILSRDIVSSEGLVLLGKGKQLTKRLIEKLRQFVEETEEPLEIYIEPREQED